MSGYEGPNEIGFISFPKRGTVYHFDLAGHDIQIYVTEKRKQVRVWVDNEERKTAAQKGGKR